MSLTIKNIEVILKKNKVYVIKALTCLFFSIGIIISHNLWVSDRKFPTIPLIDVQMNLPNSFDIPALILLLILLVIVAFNSKKIFLYLLFILLAYLLIMDQMRWQPWVYIYTLFLFPFLFYSNHKVRFIDNFLQILLVGIYIWSGIHKLNPNFNELIVESFTVHLLNISNTSLIAVVKELGSLFAIFEILTGLFLLVPKTRKIGVYMVIMIHIFIILYLSPIGINYNYVVLPWNIFMALIVFILFYNSNDKILIFYKAKKEIFLNIIVLFVLALPALNFFRAWDSYLSFSLYSGKINNYYVLLKETDKNEAFDLKYSEYFTLENQIENGIILDVNMWAMKELNIPMVPEDRIFKKIAEEFCESTNNDPIFITTNLPLWKLMYFDFYRNTRPHMFLENNKSELFYIKFKIPIRNSTISSFECQEF